MRFKKIGLIIIAGAILGMLGFNSTTQAASKSSNQPLIVNKKKKQVTMATEVNGTYFTAPTRHAIVYTGGSNGEKAILRGLAKEEALYQALIKLGAKPGNNLTAQSMKNAKSAQSTKGDKINVTIKWKGQKALPFQKVIKATKPYTQDFRFSGNLASAKKKATGCELCLDSCATGIVSDAAWPVGSTENNVVAFRGNKKVLPKDSTRVYVIFTLANKS